MEKCTPKALGYKTIGERGSWRLLGAADNARAKAGEASIPQTSTTEPKPRRHTVPSCGVSATL